jgi:cellulose synthase/poly-beta-1,6-N-acetylglucosamine synthase-like glycosyltransferase
VNDYFNGEKMNFYPTRLVEYAMMFMVIFYTISIFLIFIKHRSRIHAPDTDKNRGWEPFVSVVIPVYNEEKSIGKTIEALLEAEYPKNKMEILVVDDGSTDKTPKIVGSFNDKRIKLLRKQNEGNAAYAKNYGIKHAKGEIILTLDADSYVEKDAIRKLLMYFDEDVGAVTSAVKVYENPERKLSFIEKLQKVEYIFTIFNRKLFSFINGVWVTPGPLSAFRKEIFDELGLFNVKNIMEDQEMALRIQEANYKIASCTDAAVYTVVPNTLGDLYRQRIRWNRGGMKNTFEYKHLTHLRYGDFGLFIMPMSLVSIFLLLAILAIVSVSLTKIAPPPDFDVTLIIEPIHIFSAIVILLTALWTRLALGEMNERIPTTLIIAYMFIYSYMISFFTIIALFKEIKGDALTW